MKIYKFPSCYRDIYDHYWCDYMVRINYFLGYEPSGLEN
jgi:hypothetical protein